MDFLFSSLVFTFFGIQRNIFQILPKPVFDLTFCFIQNNKKANIKIKYLLSYYNIDVTPISIYIKVNEMNKNNLIFIK